MNKGRISKRNLLARLPLVAAVAFVCFPPVAKAQQGNPEIFVDMSVLQGLGPAPNQPQQPVKLRPPAPKPPASTQPQLIAPVTQTQAVPAYSPPPKPAVPPVKEKTYVSKAPEMPAEEVRRVISSPQQPATAPLKSEPPPPVIQKAVAVKEPVAIPPIPVIENAQTAAAPVPTPEPVAFPIKTKVRTEITDPAATASSRPVPVRSGIAGNLNDTVLSRPAPDFDPTTTPEATDSIPVRDLTEEPESATTTEPVKKLASVKPTVVPGRKPSIPQEQAPEKIADTSTPAVVPPHRPEVQKAPPELVAELRAREAAKLEAAATNAPSVDLADPPPPPGPRGKKNMPAVAKAPVESEKLAEQLIKLPANSDPLLDRLVEKDKQDLVATIESMVAAREDGKPLPESKKSPREQGSNIVKAEPMQRPYNVYRPKKNSNEDEPLLPGPEETKVAAVEEAPPASDVVTPRPPPPSNQDEQAYVSVPFSAGLTEVDAKITSEIESRLLPMLNDNPGWKLQIQAFASPVKDGVSSARKASLARAMSVRTYLLSKGIEATRMDIRALGAESDRDPMDRVDLIVFDPAKKG